MKPKILEIKSEEYPEGRIDSLTIDEENGGFDAIVSCLIKLGFNEGDIWAEIDRTLERRGYLFLYLNQKLKVHLSAESSKDFFIIRLDTSIPRETVINSFETFFELPW